ncbi:alpha/beta hydrolase [Cryobacterium tagatosivorans]|uniref:Alpha/beta hydrolase n=1 Tax=Cryobacterium tagatosivorans TaxID=1259199 RepID=A0A4R8UCK0_9MICO|nr:alpha/beta hydrolase [Cryobacterium tagatosivorans]
MLDLDWPHVFRPGSSDRPVLLMLHGTGGNEQEIAGLADALDPAAAVLAPRGRVSEGGLTRWFRRHAEGVFDVDDVVRRAGELAKFIAWARHRYDLGERRIVAVGFSNGANIALATALLHPESADRVVAFSGMFPLDDRSVSGDLSRSEVLLLNGRSDPMAPLPSVTRLVSVLTSHGAEVEQELRDGGHGITATDAAAAASWLARHP